MSTFCNYWNKVSLVKSKIKKSKKIDSIGIGLASPEEIRRWGERQLPNGTLIGKVDKDHTVDYESLKPIEGGLFCERIFGPVEDFYCSCERKGEKNEKFCPTCEVEFTKSRVRRIRMGYIPLAVPVVHVWYLRGRPSYIANLVGKSRNSIDRLAYGETLSESFIGYSSLESIYKKEENVFPKRLHDTVKFNSAAELRLPQDSYRVRGTRSQESNYDGNGLSPNDSSLTQYSDAPLPKSSIYPQLRFTLSGYRRKPITLSGYSKQSFAKGIAERMNSGVKNQVNTTPSTQRWFFQNSLEAPLQGYPHVKWNTSYKWQRSLPLRGIGSSICNICTAQVNPQLRFTLLGYRRKLLTLYPLQIHFNTPRGKGASTLRYWASKFISIPPRGKELCEGLSSVTPELRIPFAKQSSDATLLGKGYAKLETTNLQPVSFVTAEKSVTGGSRAEKSLKEIPFGHKQRYLKCHTLPLFSTFVYKEWAHRFSFLEYFIWSARNNDLVLPFYAYQNSKKRLANICESIRKSSLNLVRNKFSLRFSNKSYCNHSSNATLRQLVNCLQILQIEELQEQKVQPHFLQLRNKRGVLRVIKVKKNRSFLFHTKPNFYDICSLPYPVRSSGVKSFAYPLQSSALHWVKGIKMNNNFINNDKLRRNQRSVRGAMLTNSFQRSFERTSKELAQRESNSLLTPELRIPFAKQSSDATLLGKGYIKDLHETRVAELQLPQDPYRVRGFLRTRSKEELWPVRSSATLNQRFVRVVSSTKFSYAKSKICKSCVNESDATLLARGTPSYALPLDSLPFQGIRSSLPLRGMVKGTKESRVKKGMQLPGLRNCDAFSTIQQDTESTPLNKMDTQQFPRLTELLNFTGGAALRNLLSRFDLIVLSKFLRHELKNLELKVNSLLALKILTYSQGLLLGKLAKRRSKQIRRLKLLELFQSQKSNPEWMILSVIPVLPPDLRPILRVNDDFVVASDLNRLYQTVLRRNNTIHERLDDPLPCPESGLFRQRSLQKAVDGLLENGKGGGTPLCASKRRPLVSLSHVLKGKKGLFRQHLLGKRVDYSGRSVIVVGPRLQVHECGLPKEMAIELFQPFLLHRLKVKGLATSNTTARRMIQQGNPVIWHLLKQLIYEHPVLLNRAPTLHRLGIQAFQPRLVSGRAILLHPLVCNGFNADFDGDQMAVHVPLSFQARAEAWKIMWSKNNFLSPATGQPILVPSQDMVLGCYYLSVSIPRILNANVSIVSHDKAMTNISDLPNQRSDRSEAALLAKMQNKHISKLEISTANQNLRSKAFLNENKGQYFSNLQDSLLAYFQGRLQTHTPFWVRIDHKFARKNIANNTSFFNDSSFNFNDSSSLLRIPLHSIYPERVRGNRSSATLAPRVIEKSRAITKINYITQTNPQTNPINKRFRGKRSPIPYGGGGVRSWSSPFFKATQGYGTLLPKVRELLAVDEKIVKEKLNDLVETNSETELRLPQDPSRVRGTQSQAFINRRKMKGVPNVQYAYPEGVKLINKPNINIDNLKALKLTFLQPLYGSSRQICKALFQNKSANNFQIRVEANETLESPLELRLGVDGNLANILTMFQNYYNYNATWVKQCKEESIKYMRTTAGRVVINNVVFKDF